MQDLVKLKAEMDAALNLWLHGYDNEKFAAWHVYSAARDLCGDWEKLYKTVPFETYMRKRDELANLASQEYEKVKEINAKIHAAFQVYQEKERKYGEAKREAERAVIYEKVMQATGGK